MSTPLALRAGSVDKLARFVANQLRSLYPGDDADTDLAQLAAVVPAALARMEPIVAQVRNFRAGQFDHLHSLQYATFLYLVANESWRAQPQGDLAPRLFCLNRALNAIDLFYSVAMPEVFFISHGLSAVLGNAVYGERLVIFQNTTVGRVGDERPELGRGVVLFPGATVTGNARVGDNAVIAAGTVVHGADVPPDTVAIRAGGKLTFRPRGQDFQDLYFRSA